MLRAEILQLAPESVLCTRKNLKKKEVRILGRARGKDMGNYAMKDT
jgi:hypothetical protein